MTLVVINVKEGREESTLTSFIVSKQEHMIIYERIEGFSELTEPDGDAYYVDGFTLRGRILFEFWKELRWVHACLR